MLSASDLGEVESILVANLGSTKIYISNYEFGDSLVLSLDLYFEALP